MPRKPKETLLLPTDSIFERLLARVDRVVAKVNRKPPRPILQSHSRPVEICERVENPAETLSA